jgi:HSP20 family protein
MGIHRRTTMENNRNVQEAAQGIMADRIGSEETTQAVRQEPEQIEVRRPSADIVASETEITLALDIPGVRENGIDVTIEKNILTIKAVPSARDSGGRRLLYAECGTGEYRRSFSLPDDADKENISASLKDGVLRVRLPKIAPATKRITVNA